MLLFKEFHGGFPGQLAEETLKECELIKAKKPVDADKAGVSRVLITKILMGAFGSVPAYDRYFCAAAKECGLPQTFSKCSFLKLCDFFRGRVGRSRESGEGDEVPNRRGCGTRPLLPAHESDRQGHVVLGARVGE